MRFKEKLNYPFPFYLNDDRKNIWFVSGTAVFVFLFMLLFKTSSEHHLELSTVHKTVFGAVTFFGLFLTIIVLPRIFPGTFDTSQWTVGKYIGHTFLNIAIIGVLSTAVDELYICPERSLLMNFRGAFEQVVIIGTIPISLITLLLKNKMLTDVLRNALDANNELQKLKTLKNESPEEERAALFTITSETTEVLTLDLASLLFIQADDNYVTVFWKTTSGVEKKLLRANLKNVEAQLRHPYYLRCHRSYLVNIMAVVAITGNANGYKLQVLEMDTLIPVSRAKGKTIIEKIRELTTVLEQA